MSKPDPQVDTDPFVGAAVLGVLEAADRRYLAERSTNRRLAKGQILFAEGEASRSVSVLVSGRLNVLTHSKEGSEFILNSVTPGETVGELGVLSGGPRSATVQAAEDSVVLVLPGPVIIDLISQHPALAVALLKRLANMVRRTTGTAADLVFLDLRQRVAKYLLQYLLGEPSGTRLTQSQLAANIGASRQRVNGCLREFHQQGWIRIEPRSVQVLDRSALSDLITF